MYPFLTYMKSQKKRHLQRFLQLLDPLLLAWDETFPDKKYFLKLHHIMAHLPDFVDKYQMLGRILEESFESVHSLMARIKAMVASMTGDQKRIETANAKCQTKLKPQVMEPSIKITTANIGKKRGPAKNKPTTQNATTAPIEIAFNEVYVEGRQFIDILDGMARLPKEWKELYLLVTAGKVPQSWREVFDDSIHLTEDKKREASYVKY